ncbi:MAG: hypothetical protein ACYTG0_38120 [Planctomycetota bacterium]|jgi:hypothetical protein
MSKKPHFLAGLAAAAVVLSTLASPAWAQDPERVPRFMMTWGYAWAPPDPLDWDLEGSVAMVVMPRLVDGYPKPFATAYDLGFPGSPDHPDTIYGAIVNTLESNLAERISAGEITEAEIAAIAELLFDALDGAWWNCNREVTHVAKGGAERLTNVYFDASPPNGAMAQAGPDGNVLVLGEFWFHEFGPGESELNNSGTLVVTESSAYANYAAQIAIGWFTK